MNPLWLGCWLSKSKHPVLLPTACPVVRIKIAIPHRLQWDGNNGIQCMFVGLLHFSYKVERF